MTRDERSRSVVDNPDLQDIAENNYRARLLDFRGYRKHCIFTGFPDAVQWHSVALNSEDLEVVRVMNSDPWPAFSGDTRLAGDAARNFKAGTIKHSVSIDIAETSNKLKQGHALPGIILLGEELDKYLVILEGHVRTMAILTSDIHCEIEAIVGVSSDMHRWSFY